MAIDLEKARAAGYSDGEILDGYSKSKNFDLDGARKAGYSDKEILDRLAVPPAPKDRGIWQGIKDSLPGMDTVQALRAPTGSQIIDHIPMAGMWTNLAKGAVAGAVDQFGKAKQSFQDGEYVNAFGHGLAAALPMVGPAAANAGDAFQDGKPGEGIGQTIGLLGQTMLPQVAKAAGKVGSVALDAVGRGPVPGMLRNAAAVDYGRALNATTRGNKLRSARVVPELIDRGITAPTLKGLGEKVGAMKDQAGQAVGDAFANLPADTTVPLDPILQDLAQSSNEAHTVDVGNGRRIPMSDAAKRGLAHVDGLAQTLTKASAVDPATGQMAIPIDALRTLRQHFDETSKMAGRFDGKNVPDPSEAAAHGMAADAIRGQMAAQFPDIAKANREYSFTSDADKVIQDTLLRREGQAKPLGVKIAGAMATGAGYASHGIAGAVLTKMGFSTLESLITSPGWRTVSAVLKDRLADALTKRQPGPAQFTVNQIARQIKAAPPALNQAGQTVTNGAVTANRGIVAAGNTAGTNAVGAAGTAGAGFGPGAAQAALPLAAATPEAEAAQGIRTFEGDGRVGVTDAEQPPQGTLFSNPPETNSIAPAAPEPVTAQPPAAAPVAPPATLAENEARATATPAVDPRAISQGKANGSAHQAGEGQGESGASKTDILVPGGNTYSGRYQLRELDDVQPSHHGATFEPNPKFGLKNDRDYNNAVNQGKIINGAGPQFDPRYHITDNPDASNGPPVTDSEGNVLGGNGRTMTMQRVYQSNPKGAAAYRDLLTKKAGQFGIDPADVAGMKKPLLTRVLDDAHLTDTVKQDAVTDFNKTGTAALTPAERAIADSRRVSTGTLEHLGARLEAKGDNGTLAQVLEGKGGNEVLQKLIDDGVITPQERASFQTEDGLTEAGKTRISQLMLGRFFRDPAQLDRISPLIRNKLERIAAPLAKAESHEGWSLTDHVKQAMDILEGAQAAGTKHLRDFIHQDGLFGNQKYAPEAIQIAEQLKTTKTDALVKSLRQYASDANHADGGASMFGDPPTPAASLHDALGSWKP